MFLNFTVLMFIGLAIKEVFQSTLIDLQSFNFHIQLMCYIQINKLKQLRCSNRTLTHIDYFALTKNKANYSIIVAMPNKKQEWLIMIEKIYYYILH